MIFFFEKMLIYQLLLLTDDACGLCVLQQCLDLTAINNATSHLFSFHVCFRRISLRLKDSVVVVFCFAKITFSSISKEEMEESNDLQGMPNKGDYFTYFFVSQSTFYLPHWRPTDVEWAFPLIQNE